LHWRPKADASAVIRRQGLAPGGAGGVEGRAALFAVASMAVGAAQSEGWLIAARAVQGVGAAILAPSSLALLHTRFREGPERTRAVAYYAAVAGVASTAGLVLGGMFAGWLSWRVGFFINAPIGIAMMLAAPRYLPKTDRHRASFDLDGALSSTLGMVALVFGIVRSADAPISSPDESTIVWFSALGRAGHDADAYLLLILDAPRSFRTVRIGHAFSLVLGGGDA
jgi:MFS family permease